MASNARKCASDAPFAKDLSSVAVGIESYYTLIDFAIMANDAELVAALFEKQLQDPSLQLPKEKLTLGGEYLLNAAFSESDNVVRWLMSRGFDPNQTDEMGAAALHFSGARTEGGLRVARELVAQGADVELSAGNGVTPLILAWRQNGDLRKVQCLVSLGAQIPSASELPDIRPDMFVTQADIDVVTAFLDSPNMTIPESISRICSNNR